jgi:hypothetical protein
MNKPEYSRAYYQRNREREAARAREKVLRSKYGITEEQYQQLLQQQKECCAVCCRHYSEFNRRLAVDHDHHSGELRGLLCTFCNRYVVGRHRKGGYLKNAAAYLERETYTGWFVPPKKKKRRRRVLRSRKSKHD